MRTNRAIWVMNCLLAVIAVLLLILVLGRSPMPAAHASGGGASLDNWMVSVLRGSTGSDEYLIVCKQIGPDLRIHVYETGGPDKTMKLLEVRETKTDFAMPIELVDYTLKKGSKGQTQRAIEEMHMKWLKSRKNKTGGRLR